MYNDNQKGYSFYMKEALKLANKAFLEDEVPIGAVVVLDDKIIGRGYNKVEITQNSLRHAEIEALEEAIKTVKNSKLLKQASIFVTLEPCSMCMGAIINLKLKSVIFGAMNLEYGACGSRFCLNYNDSIYPLVLGGILEEESENLLKSFFKKKRPHQ